MSPIGSGPGIGKGPHIEVSQVRAVGGAGQQAATSAAAASAKPGRGSNAEAAMVSASALDAGEVPVDGQRVADIRKAIHSGSYPIIPVKIGDAMIAAGIMLQVRN